MSGRKTGVVKWFNETKAYGFISPDDGDRDVFVHVSSLNGLKNIAEGQRVTFEIEQSQKGLKARNVLAA